MLLPLFYKLVEESSETLRNLFLATEQIRGGASSTWWLVRWTVEVVHRKFYWAGFFCRCVVLNQERYSPPENIRQSLETLLTVTTGVRVMLTRSTGKHPTMHRTVPTMESDWPNTSVVLRLRRSTLSGRWTLVVRSSSARVLKQLLPRLQVACVWI